MSGRARARRRHYPERAGGYPVAGALLLTLVANGLIQLNIDPYWTQLFSGLMILAAGGIDRLRTLNLHRMERQERFHLANALPSRTES